MIKKIGITLLILVGGLALMMWFLSEPKPKGVEGPGAEELAQKMLKAVNKDSWDSLEVVSWTFRNSHHFIWDKRRNLVLVEWNNKKVLLNPEDRTGKVYIDGRLDPDTHYVQKAWEFFANDSFWLAAPFKLYDPGVSRSLVDTEEGQALMVTYSSGGVTPGDSYLWYPDETGRPVKWKMWVQMIPIGGVSFTWEKWEEYRGVWLSSGHDGLIYLGLSNIKVSNRIEDLTAGDDPFSALGN